jgi:hypothetical protein
MIPDFSGKFLNYEETKDGDKFVILDEGKITYNENFKVDEFQITVEHNGKKKIYTPKYKQGKKLQEAFGLDTKEWVGKVVEVVHTEDKKMSIRPIKA